MDQQPPSSGSGGGGGGGDDEVDRDDPLLITTVRARLNREEKVKKVGRKTVKRLVDSQSGDDKKAEEPVLPSIMNPRRYQQEAFKAALSKNIILYLETGGGKTLVAVLLIKALAQDTRSENGKRLIVFLAPTVLLVQQQSRVIKIHTDLKVGEYYGAKNVDNWGTAEWETQISHVQVMMMTPQVLLNNLQHGFMKMDTIGLLIFDECHHAHKNHAYAQIMKGFYHVNVDNGRLPKIFGMTASPVTKKGSKTCTEIAVQLSGLEDMLKCEVFTLKDREEVEFVAPTATTVEEHYDAPNLEVIAPFKRRIDELLKKYEKANMDSFRTLKVGFKDQADVVARLKDKLSKFHRDFQFCLEELGLWCAYKAAEHSFKADSGVNDFEGFGDATLSFKRNKDQFLKESLQCLQSAVPEGWATFRTAQDLQGAVSKGYMTPKLYHLVAILSQKRSTKGSKRIIFVERRMAAVVIASLVNQMPCLSEHFNAKSIYGANAGMDTTRGQQQSTVTAFNQGEVNLLVATDIAEEGIDVQTCSEVIRFSLPKNLRSNIQSRGRARQHGSTYIVFLERGNAAQKEQFSKILRSEPVMREEVISREHMHLDKASNSNNNNNNSRSSSVLARSSPEIYRVPSTGASVTPESSVSLIVRFCGKLPGDMFYVPRPEYVFQEIGSQHKCDLRLPPAAPIHQVKGALHSTAHLAKQFTAFEACKQLHRVGALDDNLVPSKDFEMDEEDEKFAKLKSASSGVGTTMQKELYPCEEARVLCGDWHTSSSDRVLLYAYRMAFEIQPKEDEAHVDFVLLTGGALDDDVATLDVDLLLTRQRTLAVKLSPLGPTPVSADQLSDAKTFQAILFNGMFSKMSKSAEATRKRKRSSADLSSFFLDRPDLWSSNDAYLVLPASATEKTAVDWKSIHATSTSVKHLSRNEDTDGDVGACPPPPKKTKFSLLAAFTGLFTPRQTRFEEGRAVRLAANGRAAIAELADAAVLAVHTMMIYPVVSVLEDTTAHSPFPSADEGKVQPFKTYADFFKLKYGIALEHPSQPLLQLKQSHRARNLLPSGASKRDGGKREKKTRTLVRRPEAAQGPEKRPEDNPQSTNRGRNEVGEKRGKQSAATAAAPAAPAPTSASVEMPAELCLVLGFSAAVIRSAYWVPSVMHRIKAAALASQLRRSIHAPRIPVMEVVKALTTPRCNENLDMEALELFGDSFLKYAVSRKLFLELKTVNEGVLSTKRMHRIGNRALHQLAVERGLTGYVRDCPFDPSRYAAPGMAAARHVPCHCKPAQLGRPFKHTASTVIGRFGSEALADRSRTETIKPRIGLTCDGGHRYLCSKTVADAMEALIGAYLENGSNCEGALQFMKWAGMDVECCPSRMEAASRDSPVDARGGDHGVDVAALEARIGYVFSNKYLLLEAVTHPSNMAGDQVRCYQRLEFLGDAVLDFLLTRHLFTAHPASSPGLLTSLRSASVNNERFARVAVQRKFHCYLRHGSGSLLYRIEEFVKAMDAAGDDRTHHSFGLHGVEAPKVLGDVVESIAGAILVDTCFDIDRVWAVMLPLLEPIVTPATLDMHPVTELEELCASKGYNLKCYDQHSKDKRASMILYEVQITEDLCIDGTSSQPKKKIAKRDAAAKALAKLKSRGFREKFGKPIFKPDQKIETGGAPPPMGAPVPEKDSELASSVVSGARDDARDDDYQVPVTEQKHSHQLVSPVGRHECSDRKLGKKETEQGFEPALEAALGSPFQPSSDMNPKPDPPAAREAALANVSRIAFTALPGSDSEELLMSTTKANPATSGVERRGDEFHGKVPKSGTKPVRKGKETKGVQKIGNGTARACVTAPRTRDGGKRVGPTAKGSKAAQEALQKDVHEFAANGKFAGSPVQVVAKQVVVEAVQLVAANGDVQACAHVSRRAEGEEVRGLPDSVTTAFLSVREKVVARDAHETTAHGGVHACVQITRRGDGASFAGLAVKPATQMAHDAVDALQKTVNLLPLRDSLVGGVATAAKRKLNSGDDREKRAAKLATLCWSQDMAVQQTPGPPSLPSSDVHARKGLHEDEAMDLMNFCPWTQGLPRPEAEAFLPGTRASAAPSQVAIPKVGVGLLARRAAPASNPKRPVLPEAAMKPGAMNCRQTLNEVRMKNKWPAPVFTPIVHAGDAAHAKYRYSVKIDMGLETFETQGEAKPDQKQGKESAASVVLALLKQKGISGLP